MADSRQTPADQSAYLAVVTNVVNLNTALPLQRVAAMILKLLL